MAHGLLSKEEDAAAARNGYGVYHVYDLSYNSWTVRLLPTNMVPHVMQLAQNKDEVALKALRTLQYFQGK